MDGYIIGRFLSELRKQKGLKQREVAEAVQVSDKAVSRWETGRGIPDIDSLQRLSDFYEISINEILAGRHLEADELKESSDNNLREMGKRASGFKKKLFAAIAVIMGLLVLLAVVILSKTPQVTSEVGIMTSKGYPVSDMDAFFRDVARLEREGIWYNVDFDTTYKEIHLITAMHQVRKTGEEPEEINIDEFEYYKWNEFGNRMKVSPPDLQ